MNKIESDELKKVFGYIDEHIDDHVINLQKWIQQPSISNTGEGMQESAEMVKGFFDQLGCQQTEGVRRRPDRVGPAGQSRRLREVR